MAETAGIKYQITGDVAQGLGAMSAFKSSWTGMVGAFATGQAVFAGVRSAFQGVAAGFAGVRNAFDLGGKLSDMSARTGIAVRDLAVLRKAFADAGIGAESVGPIVNIMQKSIAGLGESGESTAETFGALGLSMADLRKMSAADQIQTIGLAIAAIGDPAQRSAVAMKIFGRSGGEMLALFSDPNALKAAAATLGNQANILGRQAATFDRISDLMGGFKEKMQGLFVGIGDRMAGPLLKTLEVLNKIDLSGIGQQIGDVVGRLMKAFQDGRLGQLIGLSLKTGFAMAGNFLARVLTGAAEGLAAYWKNIPAMLSEAFGLITNPKFWTGIADVAIGALGRLGVELLKIFQSPVVVLQAGLAKAIQEFMEMLGKIPKIGKWLGLDGFKADSFENIFKQTKEQGALGVNPELFDRLTKEAGDSMQRGSKAIADAASGAMGAATTAGQDIVAGFKQGFGDAKPIFDEGREELAKAWKDSDAREWKPFDPNKGKAPAQQAQAAPAGSPWELMGGGRKGDGKGENASGAVGSTDPKAIFADAVKQAQLSGEMLTSDRRSELFSGAVEQAKTNRRILKARARYGVTGDEEAPASGAPGGASPSSGARDAASGGDGGVASILREISTKLDTLSGYIQEAVA
ncbi:MAG: hypothetical protein IT577_23710 [Verrucomicrobiae bacterium]|nr:hypothetical protein [Verrucomicrobiae bacterium]